MGTQVNIDPNTGMLSGIAPPIVSTGEYVVTVCVTEYRNGVYLAEGPWPAKAYFDATKRSRERDAAR